jgi:PAS domain S-box-containing protein/putative nucleotidyltransferase with HDIG domain
VEFAVSGKPTRKTLNRVLAKNTTLSSRLDEAEETLRAIRSGEVDALTILSKDGEQLFTRQGADYSYRALIEDMSEGALTLTAEGMILYANRRFAEMIKTPLEKVIGSSIHTWIAPDNVHILQSLLQNGTGEKHREQLMLLTSDKTTVPVFLSVSNMYITERPDTFGLVATDLTEQKRIDAIEASELLGQELLEASNQSRQKLLIMIEEQKRTEEALTASESELRTLFAAMQDMVLTIDKDGIYRKIAPTDPNLFFMPAGELLGRSLMDVFSMREAEYFLFTLREVLATGQLRQVEYSIQIAGVKRWFSVNITRLSTELTVWVVHDLTERKKAEEKTQRQLEHLTALSAIDRIVSANFDLKISLTEILTHVTIELGVDAAKILLLNTNTHMLEHGAERGFRIHTARERQVRLGESYAGHAALDRKIVQIPNLRNEPDTKFLTDLLPGEGFVCYYGVPLINKGQVKGVLEVFHRTALEPDAEWFDFLNALAGQAAIAIENFTLFESLQRSNLELSLAYDATIEGWSHALDLRDKETEGHTQRVTGITIKLARAFGLGEAELVQVRWGALLHDIGKMGVPDGILLKPGPLTDEEWVLMKKHPTFAYEMLIPIHYLRLALDIPYCHHEKWDGTGYPNGLKGNLIPLVARIFAVVDVWDALTSDRPYRKAWSKEKSLQHIQAGIGAHFDPQVVKKFLLELE